MCVCVCVCSRAIYAYSYPHLFIVSFLFKYLCYGCACNVTLHECGCISTKHAYHTFEFMYPHVYISYHVYYIINKCIYIPLICIVTHVYISECIFIYSCLFIHKYVYMTFIYILKYACTISHTSAYTSTLY